MKIAVIPARKGSVGLPNKNLKKISNLSLLDRTIQFVKELNLFDKIIVTTDYNKAEFSSKGIAVRKRPKELATSFATMVDVLLDVITEYKLKDDDFIILFQPTSPFRYEKDVKKVLSLLKECDSVITVKKLDINLSLVVQPCSPTSLKQKEVFAEETNRQHQGLLYYPNGNLFGVRVGSFLRTKSFYGGSLCYILQEGRLNIDINCKTDLDYAIQLENEL
jgi:CMP-N-acetylneuraminic acid synthetase neuA